MRRLLGLLAYIAMLVVGACNHDQGIADLGIGDQPDLGPCGLCVAPRYCVPAYGCPIFSPADDAGNCVQGPTSDHFHDSCEDYWPHELECTQTDLGFVCYCRGCQ